MRRLLAPVVLLLVVAACSSGATRSASTSSTSTTTSTAKPATTTTAAAGATCASSTTVAGSSSGAESSPPGDIPDDQAFVAYTPPTGTYTVKVPEGWARTDAGDHVTFTDKLNTIDIDVVAASTAPTVASAKATEVPTLEKATTCFELVDVTSTTRTSGPFVLITYRADAAPDTVTGKVVRDDVERYESWKNGKEAVLTLTGPAGSDNVDPWKIVTDSFTWT
jgi:putative hemolysin